MSGNSNPFDDGASSSSTRHSPTDEKPSTPRITIIEDQPYDFSSAPKSPQAANTNKRSSILNKKRISFGSRKSSQTLSPTRNLSGGFVDVTYGDDSEGGSTQVEDNDEDDDKLDGMVSRKETVMKRNRWGTQRHKKGRPPKRSKSIFKKRLSGMSHHQGAAPKGHNDGSEFPDEDEAEAIDGGRKIFINMPLPEEMIDPESGLPIADYPRNKIRTTKYTPLSFVPKNLWFQFHNIANIYFLLIVILGVSIYFFFFISVLFN